MNLINVCEPIFQYICRLKRLGRTGHTIDTDQVRIEIKNIFKEMAQKASASGELAMQYEKVELPLIFFVDFMIKESRIGLSSPWQELAMDKNEFAGDEKFFDLLDDTLAKSGQDITERLTIFYTCLALGFTGIYTGQQDTIHTLMHKLSVRISSMMDQDEKAYICPEAYENVDTRNFIEPPGVKLTGIGIALVTLIIVWFFGYIIMFHIVGRRVNKGIDVIGESKKIAPVSVVIRPSGQQENRIFYI